MTLFIDGDAGHPLAGFNRGHTLGKGEKHASPEQVRYQKAVQTGNLPRNPKFCNELRLRSSPAAVDFHGAMKQICRYCALWHFFVRKHV